MTAFITFEGIEGSGKTTQIRQLNAALQQDGHVTLQTREPGGCPISDQVREILLHPNNNTMATRTELLLYAAARAQHVEEIIQPALSAGKTVLCDRYTDATLVYQGYGRGLDRQLILQLNHLAAGNCKPDLTLLFNLPVEIGLQRALKRETDRQDSSEGRFERETLEFHQRIHDGYLALAATAPDRFRIIDANASIDQISTQVNVTVTSFLQSRLETT